MGVVIVADLRAALAIVYGLLITACRTGATAGIAAKHLAKKGSEVVAIFGAGVRGRTQLAGLNEVLKLRKAHVHDIILEAGRKYDKEMSKKPVLNEISRALKGADVVYTALL
jgi:ornithine cyclodeaminase